ncbi:MAG: NAD(P)H-dependent oxidoreductase [Propionicimonas sp.]|uniref:NADPH-dependent FMN reductase n=1 Tax=Propionicimonas sp. TaxID=1955623 RepID=UPI002B2041E6|nr:NAD(P)H-dependent oxidoreductase [Propionicimonas sp.]MEA4943946.1 NAD(P)H-dependent oxidoreductase [Propionicimonas sp.]MEA5054239.1 NAD(P)H-dependent oxidoreductase [Propionicimonas sp.]MEA5116123.1 NAD(P)H-dependent oxidoreductase [Propionicimonas sp.]
MTNLLIVNGSIRSGRIGGPIGEWVKRTAEADSRFTVDYADLAELNLPLMDEPNHPRLKKYLHEHTVAWSKRAEAADGFVFLFPEYNHSYSAPIKNAVDYLHSEWDRKPVGFVNWGGNSGGTRAQASFRAVTTALGMVATRGNIEINFPQRQLTDDGEFEPNEQQRTVLGLQLDEIVTLSEALAPLRG